MEKGWQNKQRKEEDPIERYCYDIRGERATYEITYEEMKENMAANVMHMSAIEEQERDAERQPTKPDGMTKLQWLKERRNKERLLAEKRKQGQSDWNLKRNFTPYNCFPRG